MDLRQDGPHDPPLAGGRMKLSVQYPELASPEFAVEFVKHADRLGYDTVWVTESYGYDCISTLGYLAAVTERIKLATGVVNIFSRSPALLAQSAVTIDALSGGRFVLGLGTSGRAVIAGWHGMPFERPLTRLRESIEVIRMAIGRERLVYEGEVLRLEQGIKLIAHPLRDEIPIYVASISPAGVALAGEVADGWLPVHLSMQKLDTVFADALATGAARAGRDPSACKICAFGVPVIPTADRAAARDLERGRIALYVGGMGTREQNFYKNLFVRYGYEEEAERIQDLYLGREREAAVAAVTDEMVDEVSVIGPVDECREKLRLYEQAGIDEAVIMLKLPGDDPRALLSALEQLAPAASS
jgi:F420-dependent oxidoreductase-like protein